MESLKVRLIKAKEEASVLREKNLQEKFGAKFPKEKIEEKMIEAVKRGEDRVYIKTKSRNDAIDLSRYIYNLFRKEGIRIITDAYDKNVTIIWWGI